MFINTLHENAYQNLHDRKFETALQLFNQCIEENPDQAVLHSERGVVFLQLKNKEACLADLDKSVELQPDYAYRFASRGHAKDFFGDIEGAIDDYETATELDPNDAIIYNNLGLLLEKKGKMHLAQSHFERSDKLRKQEDSLQNIIEAEDEAKSTIIKEEVEIPVKETFEETSGSNQGTKSELLKFFSNKSQWKELISYIKNGFKIKSND
ncbi:MAG: tetratricopeptide (TPR) repeat protein [Lentimonas sp.]|jgi:tetratricopeptide (TPR) repeat protein